MGGFETVKDFTWDVEINETTLAVTTDGSTNMFHSMEDMINAVGLHFLLALSPMSPRLWLPDFDAEGPFMKFWNQVFGYQFPV